MASRKAEKWGVGRFPLPGEKWILEQLPEPLLGMFGFKGEYIPERFRDVIDYTWPISYPDGTPYLKPVLAHYVPDGAPVVAFIIGDTFELDGITFVVKNYSSRFRPNGGGEWSYTFWQVELAFPEQGDA